jgi:hypothetical protein
MRSASWRAQGIASALALAVSAGASAAAEFDDPDWPCIQRKVPELSIGQMWAGPVPEPDAVADAEVRSLAQRLSPRRVSVEEVGSEAAAAVQALGPEARAEELGALFAAMLARINVERGAVIAGIGRYARHQTELADRIEAMQVELAGLEAAPDDGKDWDRIEELTDTLAWDTRIFRDRAQSLTYVCESPVLLEQRAFAIGRALAELL